MIRYYPSEWFIVWFRPISMYEETISHIQMYRPETRDRFWSICEMLGLFPGQPMVHPVSQTVTANEGEFLEILVEFCALPAYTRVMWLSWERVYVPGGEPLSDGVFATPILVSYVHRLTTGFHTAVHILYIESNEKRKLKNGARGPSSRNIKTEIVLACCFSLDWKGSALTQVWTICWISAWGRNGMRTEAHRPSSEPCGIVGYCVSPFYAPLANLWNAAVLLRNIKQTAAIPMMSWNKNPHQSESVDFSFVRCSVVR